MSPQIKGQTNSCRNRNTLEAVKVFKKHQIVVFNSLIYIAYRSQKSRLLTPKSNTFTASKAIALQQDKNMTPQHLSAF